MVLPAFVRINQNVDIEGDYLNIKKNAQIDLQCILLLPLMMS